MTSKSPTLFQNVSQIQSSTQLPIASINIARIDMKISNKEIDDDEIERNKKNLFDKFRKKPISPTKQRRESQEGQISARMGIGQSVEERRPRA